MKYDGLKISKESVDKIFPKKDIDLKDMLSGYKSPIEVMIERINGQIEYEAGSAVYKELRRINVEVDKNELIKALRYDRNQYLTGYAEGYKDGLNANKWISVDDELPEDIYGRDREQITVMVCTKSGKISQCSRCAEYKLDRREPLERDRWIRTGNFYWNKGKRVTHWQHPPEPPKER